MGDLRHVAIIGGGPAGLIAAETLLALDDKSSFTSKAPLRLTIYDAMPRPGRKFLIAGRGGLNLTHSEPLEIFLSRYGEAQPHLASAIKAFPPSALRAWCENLGEETFVGSSGRVFPKSMKASPLFRAWLERLRKLGATFAPRHTWLGWDGRGALLFETVGKRTISVDAEATLIALGGASWPKLGSNGAWVKILQSVGCSITPLRPANCGFSVSWSEVFRKRCAGEPLKAITLSHDGTKVSGEIMITTEGLEGGAIYALSGRLRETVARDGFAILNLDLRPALSNEQILARLARPRSSQSLSSFLRKKMNLSKTEIALLNETMQISGTKTPTVDSLATLIKNVPLRLGAPGALDDAISTAGGLSFASLDADLMLRARPGVFAAGEMLDWEAPTGGYLLQASFSTGVAAAEGVARWLQKNKAA